MQLLVTGVVYLKTGWSILLSCRKHLPTARVLVASVTELAI